MDLNNKKVLVLGGGDSGVSAAYLASCKGAVTTLLDSSASENVAARLLPLRDAGINVVLGGDADEWRGGADIVVYSPGVPLGSKLDQAGVASGGEAVSELAFGAAFLDVPFLAVTGTNGKTTVTEMLQHSLRAGGLATIAAGNIGLPISEVAMSGRKYDYIITEVSSFQMEHPGEFAPRAAALLNITPDHLNRHGSLEAYIRAKLSLFRFMKTRGRAVVNAALLMGNEQVAAELAGKGCLTFSADPSTGADFTVEDGWLIRRKSDGSVIRLLERRLIPWGGRHNLENALAVLAMEEAAGLDPREFALFLVTFQIGPHRLQKVAEINGVCYVDDSKATDVDAMSKALETLGEEGRPIALIAGGLDKGCALSEAIPLLKKFTRGVFCIGSCGERLAKLWGEAVPARVCKDMNDAVVHATQCVADGGTVLLSPGCASMDMFKDYGERGDVFRRCAEAIGKK